MERMNSVTPPKNDHNRFVRRSYNGAKTLSKISESIMTLSITPFSITTLSITPFSITTLSVIPFTITKISITTLIL